jgi:hypothetical protein
MKKGSVTSKLTFSFFLLSKPELLRQEQLRYAEFHYKAPRPKFTSIVCFPEKDHMSNKSFAGTLQCRSLPLRGTVKQAVPRDSEEPNHTRGLKPKCADITR